MQPAVLVLELDAVLAVIDLAHSIFAALEAKCTFEFRDLENHAGLVGGKVAQFLAREIDAVVDLKLELLRAYLAIGGKAGLDCLVDGGADLAARSIDRGPLAFFRR